MTSAGNNKSDRLDVRLPTELKRLFEQAAGLTGQSVSDFVLGVTTRHAHKVIRDHKIIELSDKDRDIFLAALDRTEARPLPGLMRAAARHKRAVG
jgi:uncharacterized protein (DUF1778 family)